MAFAVEVEAPKAIQAYLLRHLDLMRYRTLPDLDDTELERLQIAAERNTRDLLGTLGYFSPVIEITRSGVAGEPGGAQRTVRIAVQPGPPTMVTEAALGFSGAIAEDLQAAGQRAEISRRWTLPAGKTFTQEGWDDAKTQALRQLAARRYPMGRIAASRAEIDPQENTARLGVTLDSGPLYRFGELKISGLARYDPELVERIARLKPGTEYDQTSLLEAQQRLQDSGYFNSVVMELDPSADPQSAPVLVTVREAVRNRLQLGVGVSTDSGLRLSAEHTNLQLPLIGWRADSKLLLDGDTRSIESELLSQPDDGNWRWSVLGRLKNEDVASVKVRSQMLRAGRLQQGERIDRNYYLQYDRATTTATGLNETAQAISANYAWTQRSFDRLPYPTGGYGLGVELGGGLTLGSQRDPFFRTRLNWLGIWSLDRSSDVDKAASTARAGRIALRLQAGCAGWLWADSGAVWITREGESVDLPVARGRYFAAADVVTINRGAIDGVTGFVFGVGGCDFVDHPPAAAKLHRSFVVGSRLCLHLQCRTGVLLGHQTCNTLVVQVQGEGQTDGPPTDDQNRGFNWTVHSRISEWHLLWLLRMTVAFDVSASFGTLHLQPREGFGPSLSHARLDAPGSLAHLALGNQCE